MRELVGITHLIWIMSSKSSSLICRATAALVALIAFFVTANAQGIEKLSVSVETLKSRAMSDGERYNALLSRFVTADTTLTVEEAALVYYGYCCAPIERHGSDQTERFAANDSLKAGNYEAAYRLLCRQIEANPVEAQSIYHAYVCAKNTGRDKEAKLLLSKALMLAKVIIASGNGRSPETALHVNLISDEYFFLRDIVKVARIAGQRLINHKGKNYDVLVVEENGKTTDIYFSVLQPLSPF